jgi:hypothetical protein
MINACLAQTEAELDIAYQCHHDWFHTAGYIEATADGRYTDTFTPHADYFMLYQGAPLERENAFGLVRIVHTPPFRTFTEFEIDAEFQYLHDLPMSSMCELSALCWSPNVARQALPHLMRPIRYYSQQHGRRYAICNLDKRVSAIMQMLHYPLNVCGTTQHYMGSLKTPIFLDAVEVEYQVSTQNPKMWEIANLPLAGE